MFATAKDYSKECFNLYDYIGFENNFSVEIKIPDSQTDFIGCIIGRNGTTIGLIQDKFKVDINIKQKPNGSQIIVIKPKKLDDFIVNDLMAFYLNEIIKNLNRASNAIITILKLKYNNNCEFKKWQENEIKIGDEVERIYKSYELSGMSIDLVKKEVIRYSILNSIRDENPNPYNIDSNHDPTNIPIIEIFTNYIYEPNMFIGEFVKNKVIFNSYYKEIVSKYFPHNNISIRGELKIDNTIKINFLNYSNFFYKIHEYFISKFSSENGIPMFLPTQERHNGSKSVPICPICQISPISC